MRRPNFVFIVADDLGHADLGCYGGRDAAFGPVVRHMALLFSLGLAMLAPVVLTLVLVDLCLGVVARNLPQVNVLALGFGIKVVVGLGALSLASVAGSSVMARAYRSVFQTWESLLQ